VLSLIGNIGETNAAEPDESLAEPGCKYRRIVTITVDAISGNKAIDAAGHVVAPAGKAGAEILLSLMSAEVERDMAFMGAATLSDINRIVLSGEFQVQG